MERSSSAIPVMTARSFRQRSRRLGRRGGSGGGHGKTLDDGETEAVGKRGIRSPEPWGAVIRDAWLSSAFHQLLELPMEGFQGFNEAGQGLVDAECLFRTVNMGHAVAGLQHAQPGILLRNPSLMESRPKGDTGRLDRLQTVMGGNRLNRLPRQIKGELKILDTPGPVDIIGRLSAIASEKRMCARSKSGRMCSGFINHPAFLPGLLPERARSPVQIHPIHLVEGRHFFEPRLHLEESRQIQGLVSIDAQIEIRQPPPPSPRAREPNKRTRCPRKSLEQASSTLRISLSA